MDADPPGGLDPTELAALRTLGIGCVGSGGTGKSTFCARVGAEHGVPQVSEGVRDWLAARGKTGLDALDAAELSALQWQILDHRDRATARRPFIADRTALDSICFARAAGANLKRRDAFFERAEALLDRIDVFVFFPFRSELLVNDGVRLRSPVFQLTMGADLVAELRRLRLLPKVHVFEHHRPAEWNLSQAIRLATRPAPPADLRLGLFDPARPRDRHPDPEN